MRSYCSSNHSYMEVQDVMKVQVYRDIITTQRVTYNVDVGWPAILSLLRSCTVKQQVKGQFLRVL